MGTRLIVVIASAFCAAAAVAPAAAQCVTAGDPCSDGLFCTEGDTCSAALACVGTPRSCVDGDPCTQDNCDEAADTCRNPPSAAGGSCSDGLYCTVGDVCDGMGGCEPGEPRDCGDGHSCTTDSCDEGSDVCDHVLEAGNCLIRGDCVAEGAAEPSDPCSVCDPEAAGRMWSLAAPGASCGASRCAAGVRTEPACDEAGECRDVSTTCPTGICRDDASCATCVVDDECSTAEYCTGTECVATGPIGTTCDRDRQCASGVCADGVCCDRQCEGGCESCAASTVGVCTPYVEGTDPESACGMSTCDGRGACTADAGVDADAGEAGLEAHGSGCVSCAVGARRRSPVVAVLFLTLFVAVRARRRRR